MIAASHLEPAGKEPCARPDATDRACRANTGNRSAAAGEGPVPADQDPASSGKNNEARLGLLALAQSGIDPDPRNAAEVWDILAEAHEVQGDAVKAAALELRAANRAEGQGQAEAAAGFRLRGGGFLFQAGKYAEADALLSRVAEDPGAGVVRAKAGMLRAMARGRELASGAPGVTASDYASALQQQIVSFPADPATDKARWLLGTLMRAAGEPRKAEALWTAIAQGSPRWLERASGRCRRSARRGRVRADQRRPTRHRAGLSAGRVVPDRSLAKRPQRA